MRRHDGQPLYQQIKRYILEAIEAGRWGPGDRVPSEHELMRQFSVARMTVHRAVRELTAEGFLTRTAGVGTFVADRGLQGHFLEIRNIAEEITEHGGTHRAEVLLLEARAADSDIARRFDVRAGADLFHSVIVHHEDDTPIQLEDRWVHPEVAPGYLDLDFTTTTPHAFLMQVAPLHEAEHVVRAVMPDETIRKALRMETGEPCLLVERLTWTGQTLASNARLIGPGSRYRLRDRFVPRSPLRALKKL